MISDPLMEATLAKLRARGYGCEATEEGRILIRTARGIFVLSPEKAANFSLFPPEVSPRPPAIIGDLIEVEVRGYKVQARVTKVNPLKRK